MKQISLKLSEELHAEIKEAAIAKYPQFSRPVTAWIRETCEQRAKFELARPKGLGGQSKRS